MEYVIVWFFIIILVLITAGLIWAELQDAKRKKGTDRTKQYRNYFGG